MFEQSRMSPADQRFRLPNYQTKTGLSRNTPLDVVPELSIDQP